MSNPTYIFLGVYRTDHAGNKIKVQENPVRACPACGGTGDKMRCRPCAGTGVDIYSLNDPGNMAGLTHEFQRVDVLPDMTTSTINLSDLTLAPVILGKPVNADLSILFVNPTRDALTGELITRENFHDDVLIFIAELAATRARELAGKWPEGSFSNENFGYVRRRSLLAIGCTSLRLGPSVNPRDVELHVVPTVYMPRELEDYLKLGVAERIGKLVRSVVAPPATVPTPVPAARVIFDVVRREDLLALCARADVPCPLVTLRSSFTVRRGGVRYPLMHVCKTATVAETCKLLAETHERMFVYLPDPFEYPRTQCTLTEDEVLSFGLGGGNATHVTLRYALMADGLV
jgi:hypothetical protein